MTAKQTAVKKYVVKLRIRGDITESPGSARLPLHVMPGEGPVSTSCSAGLANDVDAGPSPGMTASYNRATVEACYFPSDP